nr:GDSL esterase/lipase At5g03610-like isoform X2 [Physcomitrium patens]|eukprot:XP_024368108.1 GDSL esterase/lipase At5g03610-like isoform X2 [Physcomitrella patens]
MSVADDALRYAFLDQSTCNSGCAQGAQGLFVFGDSYTDTGENLKYPYGMTWPGDGGARRSSDGHNEVDYIAAKLGVPSPTPWEDLPGNGYQTNGGVNFGVGGAAVTYAYGWKPLEKQVDEFEALVKGGTWTGDHLAQSVALVSIGVNDYTYYNQYGNVVQGVSAFIDTVVDQIGIQMQRIHNLGVGSLMVENLVPMSCMPFTTLWVNGETGCATNELLDTETNLHDAKLHYKVDELNSVGANILMLDLTKALRQLFENGPSYGFTEAYKRCCTGSCGGGDGYTVCNNPANHVIFDSIHPTEAAWKAVTDLYSYSTGFTKGATLNTWFRQNQMIN